MAEESEDLVDQVLKRYAPPKPREPVPSKTGTPVAPPAEVPEGKVLDQVLERMKRRRSSGGH
jgi:CBS domain containing-hemolysin-like protein